MAKAFFPYGSESVSSPLYCQSVSLIKLL